MRAFELFQALNLYTLPSGKPVLRWNETEQLLEAIHRGDSDSVAHLFHRVFLEEIPKREREELRHEAITLDKENGELTKRILELEDSLRKAEEALQEANSQLQDTHKENGKLKQRNQDLEYLLSEATMRA